MFAKKIATIAVFAVIASPATAASVYIQQLEANLAPMSADYNLTTTMLDDVMAPAASAASYLNSIEVPVGGLALIHQVGDTNQASIDQQGNHNLGLIFQIGANNLAGIQQTGNNHRAMIYQNGNNNRAFIRQR